MKAKFQKLVPVPHTQVGIDDEFWSPKLNTFGKVTLDDVFTKFENYRSGILNNFAKVREGKSAKSKPGEYTGFPFFDGLIYETICAASNFLASRYDKELDDRLNKYIEIIASVQSMDPDGFIDTYTTLHCPEQRWGENGGNSLWQHNLYNAGVLVEAGVHHYRATGRIDLLKVAVKYADYMCKYMGAAPKKNMVPEHPLPEEALLKLYNLFRQDNRLRVKFDPQVDETTYLELAKYWIDNRGNHAGRTIWPPDMGEVAQDHKPLMEQDEAVGHAVRATLLYSGTAALAMATGENKYFDRAEKLWRNVVYKKMHITGGVGAVHDSEKFGPDYFLPNDAYLETCAAVGMVFWNHNMNLAFGESKYIDILERVLYNGTLSGVSLTGNRYFYQNPLVSHGNHHRWDWHHCPCCPPMLLKLLSTLGSYIYAYDENGVYINLYASGKADVSINDEKVTLIQETLYPWEGYVKISVITDKAVEFNLNMRIPDWCIGTRIRMNGESIEEVKIDHGYARMNKKWETGDFIELHMPMPVQRMEAHPNVEKDRGMVAIQRGPVVYCLEETDNDNVDIVLPADPDFTVEYRPDFLGGVSVIKGKDVNGAPFTAIPYYAWDNRIPGRMRVWLQQKGKWDPVLKIWNEVGNLAEWENKLYAPMKETEV